MDQYVWNVLLIFCVIGMELVKVAGCKFRMMLMGGVRIEIGIGDGLIEWLALGHTVDDGRGSKTKRMGREMRWDEMKWDGMNVWYGIQWQYLERSYDFEIYSWSLWTKWIMSGLEYGWDLLLGERSRYVYIFERRPSYSPLGLWKSHGIRQSRWYRVDFL